MAPGPAGVAVSNCYYEGSDVLKPGYLLCANSDSGTAANVQSDRWHRAEKPATGKLHNFMGVVAKGRSSFPAEPNGRDIYLPGSVCEVFTDQVCTIDSTLLTVQPGSYLAGGVGQGMVIGKALQTVDRSTVNGLVLCKLFGINPLNDLGGSDIIPARARTTVQLPTKAIWENFDLNTLRANRNLGSFLECDFTGPKDMPTDEMSFTDTSSTITSISNAAVGELLLFTTADNEAAEVQWLCPITLSGGNPWAFGARLKAELVTTEKASFEIGLSNRQALAGDLQADGGAAPTASTDYILWNSDAAATTALDLRYLLSGQTAQEHDAAVHTIVANTYFTVEMYYNGTTIAQYVNGVVVADPITATDIAAATFPAAQVACPTIGLKGAHTDDFDLTLDWIMAAQYA